MKYVKQLFIILAISFIGEGLKMLIPLPIPGSIYGLVILFIGLCSHIIPLEAVHETAGFLIEIMPIMFVPPAVGLLTSWGILKPVWVPVVVITLISTVLVMGVSGRVTQSVYRREKNKAKEK